MRVFISSPLKIQLPRQIGLELVTVSWRKGPVSPNLGNISCGALEKVETYYWSIPLPNIEIHLFYKYKLGDRVERFTTAVTFFSGVV